MVKLVIVINIRKTLISKNACVEESIKTNPARNDETADRSTGIPTADVIILKY